jgi:hypothetical protein
MSIGIGNEHEVSLIQVVLGANEVLRVTAGGQFVWNPDADRMIEEGDFNSSPALPHILRALRHRQWVGLTDEEIVLIVGECAASHRHDDVTFAKEIEAKLREKNGG